jgi:hypothetical protein
MERINDERVRKVELGLETMIEASVIPSGRGHCRELPLFSEAKGDCCFAKNHQFLEFKKRSPPQQIKTDQGSSVSSGTCKARAELLDGLLSRRKSREGSPATGPFIVSP